MTELWSAEQAAAFWKVSVPRARAVLASRKIKRVSGYPADQVKAVTFRQGARTDLTRQASRNSRATGQDNQGEAGEVDASTSR